MCNWGDSVRMISGGKECACPGTAKEGGRGRSSAIFTLPNPHQQVFFFERVELICIYRPKRSHLSDVRRDATPCAHKGGCQQQWCSSPQRWHDGGSSANVNFNKTKTLSRRPFEKNLPLQQPKL
jgi:hypothetical protein